MFAQTFVRLYCAVVLLSCAAVPRLLLCCCAAENSAVGGGLSTDYPAGWPAVLRGCALWSCAPAGLLCCRVAVVGGGPTDPLHRLTGPAAGGPAPGRLCAEAGPLVSKPGTYYNALKVAKSL